MVGWSAVVFGINSTRNAGGKEYNSTRRSPVLFYSFLPALLALLIPNTTADHPITYTKEMISQMLRYNSEVQECVHVCMYNDIPAERAWVRVFRLPVTMCV